MSSRRKSRPVRRLDTICSELQGYAELQQNVYDDRQSENSSTPCESPLGSNQCLNSESRDSNTDEEKDNMQVSRMESDTRKSFENPPEGVYILQPQGFSDDEGQEVSNKSFSSFNSEDADVSKKRQRDDERMDGYHGNDSKKEGLDLTVKRRKTDESHGDHKEIMSSHEITETRLNGDQSTVHGFQLNMKRYENLLQLLAKRKPLVESMREVGLSQSELVTLQRLRLQMMGNNQQNANEENASDGFEPGSGNQNYSAWSQRQDGAAETWQSNQDHEGGDSSASPLKTGISSTAVAAAVMASLKSRCADENSSNSDIVPSMIFKRSQAMLPQTSSSPTSPTVGQYSTSADAIDTITAGTVSSGVGSIKKGTLDPTNFDEDVFDKYITKFSAKNSCMQPSCPHINRDHFHCTDSDCSFQRFTNKSDVIRHYNMHKKRDNSLAHGFMRFAPTDNCSAQFGACHLNGKSTHYHCLHTNCTKVYTSTSDVMTHENFHKKNQQFVTNGFQRYRATESCGADYCPFRHQRTTHFHCTRRDCNFTFKNKCDIEKHKAYHMRDDAYARQGFKKFYKNEPCQFPSCAWNRTANHFHCLRKNCDFSFTSTSQMVSHKRKHDRQDLIGSDGMTISPAPTMLFKPGSSGKFDPTIFQEAARKVLASIPASVAAAAVPRNLNFSSKREMPSLQAAANPASTSPMATSSAAGNSFRPRGESQSDAISERGDQFDRPPPPYGETSDTASARASSPLNDEDADSEHWNKRNHSPASCTPPVIKKENHFPFNEIHNRSVESSADDGQALNLSGKGNAAEEALPPKSHYLDSSPTPSPAVLKFFRGLAPNECVVDNCVFVGQHHFHCVVQDCCAVFTEKRLVLSHTAFHDKLDKIGVSQSNSRYFPPFFTSTTSASNSTRDPNSPPPGYIALPVTNRSRDSNAERGYDSERLSTIFNRTHFDREPRDGALRQNSREANQTESSESTIEDTRRPSVYNFMSRVLTDGKAVASYQNAQSSLSPGGYVMLQNPSVINSIIARQKSSSSHGDPKDQQDSFKSTHNASSVTDGYVHVKAGMQCMRPDCKYILQSHWHCTLNRCRYVCKSQNKAISHRQAHDSLEAYARAAKESFRSYTVKKNCPNPNCEFRLRGHYHCLKPGCQFVTIGTSKLPWHMKKHEKIAKREASGFKYYTKKEQCGKHECKYNGLFSHYHCIRAGCSFAFQYKHQMSTHVRKHLRRMLGRSYNGVDMTSEMTEVDHSNVDSGDDSLPLIVDEADELEQRPGVPMETTQLSSFQAKNPTSELSQQQLAVLEQISRGMKPPLSSSSKPPAVTTETKPAFLLGQTDNTSNSLNGEAQEEIASGDEVLDLRASTSQETDSNSAESGCMDYSTEACDNYNLDKGGSDDLDSTAPATTRESSELTCFPFKHVERPNETGALFTKFRLNNDVMNGFKRFEISENCGDTQCAYAFKVSHYHCQHEGCNYRFTGRTHMFKHHQHHERVAGLVRDDFKRFKPSQDCEVSDCPFNGTSTHFHCLRCQFKCTDSAKVGTHRRQHVKADTLEQSGFERFRGKDDCKRENCKYRDRNTSHFHCLQPGCSYTVVGLSSIEQHFNKHKRSMHSMMNQPQVNFSIFAKQLISRADSSAGSSTFAESSINNSPHITSYSVPFNALASTPSAPLRVFDRSSPVIEERSSLSPSFNTSIVTSQFDSGIPVTSQTSSLNLSGSLNLSAGIDRAGLPGLSAGLS